MADNRIKRDCMLYMEPHSGSYGDPNDFASCKTCFMFMGDERQKCYILGPDLEVRGIDTCGLYINGEPETQRAGTEKKLVTEEEAGFLRKRVQCKRCYFYVQGGLCGLFAKLNMKDPSHFNLDPVVLPNACCDGWVDANAEFKEKDFFEILNQKLTLKEFFKK